MSQQVGWNNLDFHIIYENKDEMGRLCREFERMRGAIAHDIRSPLSVLEGYQEMLLEYLPEKEIDIEQALEMVNDSRKQIERIDVFVETMRKMNSLEARELVTEEITKVTPY